MEQAQSTRLIVGITGATGTIFGVRLLQMLHGSGVETHLVVSKWAARTLTHETPHSLKYVQSLATQSYGIGAQGAAISSGSFVTLGMVIAPCSMRTLAAIAHLSLIHISEPTRQAEISYAVFCLKKKKINVVGVLAGYADEEDSVQSGGDDLGRQAE